MDVSVLVIGNPSLADLLNDWLDGTGNCHRRYWRILAIPPYSSEWLGNFTSDYTRSTTGRIRIYNDHVAVEHFRSTGHSVWEPVWEKIYAADPDFFDKLDQTLSTYCQ